MKADIERWEKNVAPLLPDPCDIMIYPFGSDVGDWRPYTEENEKYRYLQAWASGTCNVDSRPYWVETGGQFSGRPDGTWTATGCGWIVAAVQIGCPT